MKGPLALLGVSIASYYTSHKLYKHQQEQRSKTSLASPISEKQPQEPLAEPPQQSPSPPAQYPWWNPPVRHEAKYAELMNVPWIR
ncbi:hypothetical protein ABW21_db0208611 [Orbilia brochopaga]|nr:hypothetical protein ABW21_db0208611 [Drechslerella brochopaga]